MLRPGRRTSTRLITRCGPAEVAVATPQGTVTVSMNETGSRIKVDTAAVSSSSIQRRVYPITSLLMNQKAGWPTSTKQPELARQLDKPIAGRQKKSLVAMLKKIDCKLLDVLHKNSELLSKSQLRKLSQDQTCPEPSLMIPKNLSSRRIEPVKRKSMSRSSSSVGLARTSRKTMAGLPSTSYIQIDLSKSGSRKSIGRHLAHSGYSSSLNKPATGSARGSNLMHKKALSQTMGSIKPLDQSKTLKKAPPVSHHDLCIDCQSAKTAVGGCARLNKTHRQFRRHVAYPDSLSALRSSNDSLQRSKIDISGVSLSKKSRSNADNSLLKRGRPEDVFWAPPARLPQKQAKELVIKKPSRAKKRLGMGKGHDAEQESTARFNVALPGDTDRTRDAFRDREKASMIRDASDSRFKHLKEEM